MTSSLQRWVDAASEYARESHDEHLALSIIYAWPGSSSGPVCVLLSMVELQRMISTRLAAACERLADEGLNSWCSGLLLAETQGLASLVEMGRAAICEQMERLDVRK